jgi:hypothetical protein
VIERRRKRGRTYAIRFRAHGGRYYVTLGTSQEGWTRRKAEDELSNVMADVRRGIWQPMRQASVAPETEAPPDFHRFATDWLAKRELDGLRPRSLEYLRWALSDHLLPYFRTHQLAEITRQEVDRYAMAKAAEGRLANSSINKTLDVLGAIVASHGPAMGTIGHHMRCCGS